MSLGSFFGTIGHGLASVFTNVAPKIETATSVASVIIGAFNPPLGAVLKTLSGVIAGLEAGVTTAQQGVLKKQTATQIALAEIPQLEAIVAAFGANVKVPQQELGDAIDAIVAANNKTQALVKAIEAANKPAVLPPAK